MALDGKIVQELQTALLDAFSAADLTRLVRFELNENLDAIASGGNLTQTVFDLITWADRNGRIDELIAAAQRQNSDNPALKHFVQEFGDTFQSGRSELESASSPSAESPIADEPQLSDPNRKLRVFLCHASEDKEAVRQLYHRLEIDRLDPWLDEESLLPGQEWQREIPRAVRSADAVLVCLSNSALDKEGYVQQEIQFALDAVNKQRDDLIYLIPVRLDACQVPENLRRWHWVDLFAEQGYARLLAALRDRSEKLGLSSTIADAAESPFVAKPTRRRSLSWFSIVGAITLLATVAGLLADSWDVWDRFFPPAVLTGPTATATTPSVAFVPTATESTMPATATDEAPLVPSTDTPTNTPTTAPTSTDTETPLPVEPPTETPTNTSVPPTATFTPTRTPTATSTSTPTSTPTPKPPAVGERRTLDGIDLVYVPAGTFIMGSTDEEVDYAFELCQTYYEATTDNTCERSWFEDEQPQKDDINVPAFWIMQYEVTNAQYRGFIDDNGYMTDSYWTESGRTWRDENDVTGIECDDDNDFSDFDDDNKPVTCISWYEATAYAGWLSQKTDLDFRLPTEAEWEKAARGTDGRIFPWGDEWDPNNLNYCDSYCIYAWADKDGSDVHSLTASVGTFETGRGPYNAYNMAGNVWEWTSTEAIVNDMPTHIVRGGSWYDSPNGVRAASRGRPSPHKRWSWIGVRLVLSPGS